MSTEKVSPGKALKKRWREECFKRVDNDWVPTANSPSLKEFARKLLKEGDSLASDWFACKGGAMNQERSNTNKVRITAEKLATKSARKKSKTSSSKPAV